jgi:hypothetical protein
VHTWREKPDDVSTALIWIRQNTAADAVVLAAPNTRNFWYLSRRAEVVSWFYPRYDRLTEWRKRISDVVGGTEIVDRDSAAAAIESGFDGLSVDQINELKRKYAASYILTRTAYPFPLVFEQGDEKVYQLP